MEIPFCKSKYFRDIYMNTVTLLLLELRKMVGNFVYNYFGIKRCSTIIWKIKKCAVVGCVYIPLLMKFHAKEFQSKNIRIDVCIKTYLCVN